MGILILVIFLSCFLVTRSTICFCGSFVFLGTFAVFFNNIDVGGVFKMNVKDLFLKMVILIGMIIFG